MEELEQLASPKSRVMKVSTRDLSYALSQVFQKYCELSSSGKRFDFSDIFAPKEQQSENVHLVNLALIFFTALRGIQTRSGDENSVCSSVCLSVKPVNCKKKRKKTCPDFYSIRKTILPMYMV